MKMTITMLYAAGSLLAFAAEDRLQPVPAAPRAENPAVPSPPVTVESVDVVIPPVTGELPQSLPASRSARRVQFQLAQTATSPTPPSGLSVSVPSVQMNLDKIHSGVFYRSDSGRSGKALII